MTTIQVSVTASDIEQSRTASAIKDIYDASCDCPIARALRREIPDARVGPYQFRHNGQTLTFLPLPTTAQNFIRAFDAGEQVKPLVFELEVPK